MSRLFMPSDFKPQAVTEDDMNVASLAWGFTLGFGVLTFWTAMKQTRSIWLRHGKDTIKSPYVWMIWLEILVCFILSVVCWLHLNGDIPDSFAFYFGILVLWSLQVQLLLQIIVNRVSLLLFNHNFTFWLKFTVAALITAINISVFCIWIPARLQVSREIIYINSIWDRIEKCLYLVIDASLNWYFMHVVQRHCLELGLDKYRPLLKFNLYIVFFSLTMDLLIIVMMSYGNTFVYEQFHPLAYIVKLNIEMSMADLLAKVSRPPVTSRFESFDTTYSNHTVTRPPPASPAPAPAYKIQTPKSRLERPRMVRRTSTSYILGNPSHRRDFSATSSLIYKIDPSRAPDEESINSDLVACLDDEKVRGLGGRRRRSSSIPPDVSIETWRLDSLAEVEKSHGTFDDGVDGDDGGVAVAAAAADSDIDSAASVKDSLRMGTASRWERELRQGLSGEEGTAVQWEV